MKILEMAASDRPREKLFDKGPAALSDAELLSILLRTGTRKMNAVDMARRLLDSADGNLEALSRMSVERMCLTEGIGPGKALSLASAVELGRRMAHKIVQQGKLVMDNPEDAAKLLLSLYTTDAKEECWCLLLKRNRRLITSARISEGGETMTEIDTKAIVRKALDTGACAVILSHNHPGGSPLPSKADIKETIRIKQALETFEVTLMDHIIMSENSCYSFSTEKVFDIPRI